MLRAITIHDVRYTAVWLAKERLSFDEPIPDFDTRFPGILESCLATPFQEVFGRALYTGLATRAAVLFYLLVKNHPFQNGNKRIAITTLLVFLAFNKKWLKVELQPFYKFALWVAASKPKEKSFVLMGSETFIRRHLVNVHV